MTNRSLRTWIYGVFAGGILACVLYVATPSSAQSPVRDLIPVVVSLVAAVLAYQFQRRLTYIRRCDQWAGQVTQYVGQLELLLEELTVAHWNDEPSGKEKHLRRRAASLYAQGRGLFALGSTVAVTGSLNAPEIESHLAALQEASPYASDELDPEPIQLFVCAWPQILASLYM